jgi:hypothetical protein
MCGGIDLIWVLGGLVLKRQARREVLLKTISILEVITVITNFFDWVLMLPWGFITWNFDILLSKLLTFKSSSGNRWHFWYRIVINLSFFLFEEFLKLILGQRGHLALGGRAMSTSDRSSVWAHIELWQLFSIELRYTFNWSLLGILHRLRQILVESLFFGEF